jgi:hypothetical protein
VLAREAQQQASQESEAGERREEKRVRGGHGGTIAGWPEHRNIEIGARPRRPPLCIVDEEAEDYLYPEARFIVLEVPLAAARRLRALEKSA